MTSRRCVRTVPGGVGHDSPSCSWRTGYGIACGGGIGERAEGITPACMAPSHWHSAAARHVVLRRKVHSLGWIQAGCRSAIDGMWDGTAALATARIRATGVGLDAGGLGCASAGRGGRRHRGMRQLCAAWLVDVWTLSLR